MAVAAEGLAGGVGRGAVSGRVGVCHEPATGINRPRLTAHLTARLDAVEAVGKEAADEQPLAPFPPRPDSPPAAAARGDGVETVDVDEEDVG